MIAGKQILDAADIDRMITRITYEILERHKGVDDLALIGIHTRGVFIAKRIQEKIKSIEGEYVDTGELNIDGVVKSPISALRYILRHCGVR